MANVEELIPLQHLICGQRAVIHEVAESSSLGARLRELGLEIGRRVEMVQAGTPCVIRLEGSKLCVRASELGDVLVRLGDFA